jgi:YggT family protein
MMIILNLLVSVLEIYFYIMIAVILLSWFPELRSSSWYRTLIKIADPYLRIFRGIIVIGQFDFTPILGFLLYQYGLNALQALINTL